MFCYQCGKEIGETSHFCRYCGTAFNAKPKVRKLASERIEQDEKKEAMNLASQNKRFLNYFIDLIVSIIIWIVLLVLFGVEDAEESSSTYYLFMMMYYFVSELIWKKTPGKMLTRTRVVNKLGNDPTFGQILGRTLSRFIPFEAFSFLATDPIGWHDKFSNTRVVED